MYRIWNTYDNREEMLSDNLVGLLAEFGNGNMTSPSAKKYQVQVLQVQRKGKPGEWHTLLSITVWAVVPEGASA